jgi:hypothetical protein
MDNGYGFLLYGYEFIIGGRFPADFCSKGGWKLNSSVPEMSWSFRKTHLCTAKLRHGKRGEDHASSVRTP